MPEHYPSIGDAVGAAMQHNIRLAHGDRTPGSDEPLQVRFLPRPAADPYSVPGMIVRLTENATPAEVASIIEEVNGTLVGALPQLTELVAAAADWVRARVPSDPTEGPAVETWARLVAAHDMLLAVREQLEVAEDGVAACPAELGDPRHRRRFDVLRTRELLHDVLGAPAPAVKKAEENRQRAARSSSPNAVPRKVPPASPPNTAGSPPVPRAPLTR
ncbi:hypothetical protein ACFV97_25575 [Streptomyces sp. NPDC059913]|uniref:hypothetical protein n=1 Tax=unclassified Streptomyces TaxID=2593676 RepID=UPI00366509A8